MPVFRLFGVFFRVAVDPPVVPPPPPGVGFRLQVFWGDSAKTPHLSTHMEIARLYPLGVWAGTTGFLHKERKDTGVC